MTTKSEFVEMWNNVEDKIKVVVCDKITIFAEDCEMSDVVVNFYIGDIRIAVAVYESIIEVG